MLWFLFVFYLWAWIVAAIGFYHMADWKVAFILGAAWWIVLPGVWLQSKLRDMKKGRA